MKRISLITLLLPLCSLFLACAILQKETPPPHDRSAPTTQPVAPAQPAREALVAKINGTPITLAQFDRLYKDYLAKNKNHDSPVKSKEQFLQQIISDALLQQYADQHALDREPQFQHKLEEARRQLLIDYVMRDKLFRNIQVSNAEIEAYYNTHIEEYTQPEKIQVRLILTNTIEEAQKALERLRAGDRFADVARDLSIHASRTNGGVLDPFSRGTYNKPFEDAAFALKVGELSNIIRNDAGFSIIEKTAEIPRQVKSLSEVRGKISDILLAHKEQIALNNFLAQLKSSAHIETYPIPE